MRGLCKRAEVKEFGVHSIRHMVASILNDTHKVSKKKIQKILRHQSQRTTEIYLHALETDLTDTMKLLEEEKGLSEAKNL